MQTARARAGRATAWPGIRERGMGVLFAFDPILAGARQQRARHRTCVFIEVGSVKAAFRQVAARPRRILATFPNDSGPFRYNPSHAPERM
jgi:hypothetical protein